MSTILRIDSSSRSQGSHSRQLGDYFESVWLQHHPQDRILRRDLATDSPPTISQQMITGFFTPPEQRTDELRSAVSLSDHLIEELQSADILMITVPMYNFSVPAALKAWVDQIVRIGKTFSFEGSSFTGLVTVKRAFVFCSYGAQGYIGDGPMTEFNFLEPYLRLLLSFLGISEIQFFSIEGTTGDSATVNTSTQQVQKQIDQAITALT